MAVKADWHESTPAEEGGSENDPFALASSIAMKHADLSLDFSVDQISDRIRRLFAREKFLFDRLGLQCPIKEQCDTTCLACPLNEANNSASKKGQLCRVGVEQDQAETLLAVKLGHGL